MTEGAPGFARQIQQFEAKVDIGSRPNARDRNQRNIASGFCAFYGTIRFNP
jgi:hypothetical protein